MDALARTLSGNPARIADPPFARQRAAGADRGYRRDIDGLRSLAILPVLLYHANVPWLSGGYVGVDIFFVISGYLITGILVREMDSGTFSLAHFYERRARRILPALYPVIAFVLGGAALLYLPGDFAGVPWSALATLAFLGNAWFFTQTGYFAGGSETMPLLHCWSLALEEQFYIAFPLLLWLCRGWLRGLRKAVVVLAAIVSFALAVLTQDAGDGFAFYLLPARAWELFTGALLALGLVPRIERRWLREVLAGMGLAVLFATVVLYDRNTPFPGLAAIPPVLAAALLIHVAPGTLVGRLLSTRLLVGIGLISYSLYLWHWPLIVFAEYRIEAPLTGIAQALVLALSFVLAWASWRYVERPFRAHGKFSRRQIFVASAAGAFVIAGVAGALASLQGWPGRFAPEVARHAEARNDVSPRRNACLSQEIGGERPLCTLGAALPPSAMLWGDSHGVELAWVLGTEMSTRGESLIQRTRASCPPVLDHVVAKDPGCARFNADVISLVGRTPSIRTVYLAAFWESDSYRTPRMIDNIGATIRTLRGLGRRVVIIGPVPSQPFDVPRHLALSATRGRDASGDGRPAADYLAATAWFRDGLPGWKRMGTLSIDPARALVQGGRTNILHAGKPLYFDSHHLSLAGARRVLEADPTR